MPYLHEYLNIASGGFQLQDPQIERGHLQLADAMQPPTLVACSGQWHREHTPDQTRMQELAMGIGRQEFEQGIPHNTLPSVTRET